ncbi:MAG: methyltransferase domain-containing protein [Dehalococcoidia bacterium]|nr:methyltransferase domain-containing protein [Dehalococcoidia bacterium]
MAESNKERISGKDEWMRRVSFTKIHRISGDSVEQYVADFLCDDSIVTYCSTIISSASFTPISFTVEDRVSSSAKYYVSETEGGFDDWCNGLILDQLERIADSEWIRFDNIDKAKLLVRENLQFLLEYRVHGITMQQMIWNQEFIDVLRRVISFSITGNPNVHLQTHRIFNQLARRIIPEVLNRIKQENMDSLALIKLAIASGLSGLDLKGAGSASSTFSQTGILMSPYINTPLEESVQSYHSELMERFTSPTPVFHWERFLDEISDDSRKVKIVWFTDDYIETLFDLLFFDHLLDEHPNIVVTVIPKNGPHGNDASWSDVTDFLSLEIFARFRSFEDEERFSVCKSGPRMGTINIRKLSPQVVDIINEANFVVIKGCRAHEMIQGGLNKPSFTMYVVSREFSESITGYDAQESPLLFFYLSPGEYAFYGWKERYLRTKAVANGRIIRLCRSTLEDHERRSKMSNAEDLVAELRNLQSEIRGGATEPTLKEANHIAEKLINITKKAYNAVSERYTDIRGEEPHEQDRAILKQLLELAKTRVQSGQLGDTNGCLALLDVGTGSGRDIRYLLKFPNLKVIGIDNSDGFIHILKELADRGEIPTGSYRKMDMRDLSGFPDESFDIVRHNASIIHLPVIGKGYGADLALSESRRILKQLGLIYVSVKEGKGLKYVDTEEGLGGRVFQFYEMKTIKDLISMNGFRIVHASKVPSSRGEKIAWISIIAEKS